MSIKISDLINRQPDGCVDTEIGRLAIFPLSNSADRQLRSETEDFESTEEFARVYARLSCFPTDKLREGKYRPKGPLHTGSDTSRLSIENLQAIAQIALASTPRPSTPATSESYQDGLEELMHRTRDLWEETDRSLSEALNRINGYQEKYRAIGEQIQQLPISPPPLPLRSVSDTTLPKIQQILLEMNEQARVSSLEAGTQGQITRQQNYIVICITSLGLALTFLSLVASPLSRLSCWIMHERTAIMSVPRLSRTAAVACGFNVHEGRDSKQSGK